MNVICSSLIAAMPNKLAIRPEMDATALRLGASMRDPSAASGAYAITNALDGLARAEAARLAGLDRQALRDAVMRYNAEGLAGLSDRPIATSRR